MDNIYNKKDWFKHFSSLFNDNSTYETLEPDAYDVNISVIKDTIFNAETTEEEVLASTGQDGIPLEFYIHA